MVLGCLTGWGNESTRRWGAKGMGLEIEKKQEQDA